MLAHPSAECKRGFCIVFNKIYCFVRKSKKKILLLFFTLNPVVTTYPLRVRVPDF